MPRRAFTRGHRVNKIYRIDDKEYFGPSYNDYISKSRLFKFAKDPVAFFTKDEDDYDPNKEYLVRGSALHKFLLEGEEEFFKEYTVADVINPRTGRSYGRATKAFQEYCEENDLSPPFTISSEMLGHIKVMSETVLAHPTAGNYLRDYIDNVEVVLRGEFEGLPAQGKVDGLSTNHNLIIDIKTCRSLDLFAKNFYEYGYDWQAALYSELYQQAFGNIPDFIFIAITTEGEPYCLTVDSRQYYNADRIAYMRYVADVYKRCIKTEDYRLALFELAEGF